ncbi:hypothetical protein ACP70R_015044 [Stipagrostis hirtigluma subsp. patula]
MERMDLRLDLRSHRYASESAAGLVATRPGRSKHHVSCSHTGEPISGRRPEGPALGAGAAVLPRPVEPHGRVHHGGQRRRRRPPPGHPATAADGARAPFKPKHHLTPRCLLLLLLLLHLPKLQQPLE